MFNLIPTEEIVYKRKKRVGKDPIGNPIFEVEESVIKNCVVTPLSASEMTGPLALLQNTSYSIHLPEGVEVEKPSDIILRGREYRVAYINGPVTHSPLLWDRSIVVEAVGENG